MVEVSPISADRERIDTFEGLRGLLALIVCVGHLGLNTVTGKVGVFVRFDQAVPVFFALSGFVMCRSYYLNGRGFADLLVGRIARLLPLHIVTLLWTLCLFQLMYGHVDLEFAVKSIFLLHNIGLPPNKWDFNFPSWSISVEFIVSILFFFVVLRVSVIAVLVLLLSGITVCSILSGAGIHQSQNIFHVINVGLLGGFGWFAIGCAAHILAVRYRAQLRERGWVACLLQLAIVPFFILPETHLTSVAFALVVFTALALAACNDRASMMSRKPFVFLGAISYSVYLLHMPVYWSLEYLAGEPVVRGAIGKTVIIAIVLMLAVVSFKSFELPAKRLLTKELNKSLAKLLT